jgi:hypothetical protein
MHPIYTSNSHFRPQGLIVCGEGRILTVRPVRWLDHFSSPLSSRSAAFCQGDASVEEGSDVIGREILLHIPEEQDFCIN